MKLLFIFLLLLLLRLISSSTADLAYLFMAILATLGGKNTIYAFTLCWFFTLINPILAPDNTLGMMGRYLVILGGFLGAAFKIFTLKNTIINKYILYTFTIFFMVFIHSFIFSGIPSVSILKILSWLIVFSVLFYSWNQLDTFNKEIVYKKLLKFLEIILIFSIPFLFIPTIGYARNGTGFQGLLNHPQAFGPTISLFGVIIGGKILANKNNSFYDLFLFILCVVFVVLSEARTAGLGLFLALFFGLFLNPILSKKSFIEANPVFQNKWTYFYIILIIFTGYLFSGVYFNIIKDYLFKRTDAESLFEAAESSRGTVVDNMILNIENNPLSGIGFGMSSKLENLKVEYDPFFNIPISAAIEKGVLPLAVLEELGIILGSLVLVWFIISCFRAAQIDVQKLCIVICIVCLNLGEYMFFSVGGMGMLMLVFFTFSVVLRKKSESI